MNCKFNGLQIDTCRNLTKRLVRMFFVIQLHLFFTSIEFKLSKKTTSPKLYICKLTITTNCYLYQTSCIHYYYHHNEYQ